MDLYLLNEINKLKSGGGGGSSTGTASIGRFGPESVEGQPSLSSWVSFYANNWRLHTDQYRYDSSFPDYGSMYVYGGNGSYDASLGFWNTSGSARNASSPESGDVIGQRAVCQGTYGVLGYGQHRYSQSSSQNYKPWSSNVVFVRNPTATDITQTVGIIYTNGWNNGYEGVSLWKYTPNGSNYLDTTGGSWTTEWNTSSGGSSHTTDSQSVTFPANKTVAIMLMTSDCYWTSNYNGGLMININGMYNIHSWQNAGLQCDMQVSQVWEQMNNNSYNNIKYGGSIGPWKVWQDTGKVYGNRLNA